MADENNKKNLIPAFMFLAMLFYIAVGLDWLLYHELISRDPDNYVSSALYKLFDKFEGIKMMLLSFFFCVSMAIISYLTPNRKLNEEVNIENRKYIQITAAVLAGLFIMGFKTILIYSLFVYPIIFLLTPYWIYKACSFMNDLVDKSYKGDVSCEPENEMSYTLDTDLGPLRVHSPQQGIYIESGAGGGKSFNLIEPFLFESVMKGYAGFVYDFKGNPPTLSKAVYSALLHKKNVVGYKADEVQVKFAFLNFVNLEQTVRCNPWHPRYLTSDLHVKEAATTLMLNLNKSWIKSRDFWADNAISILDATIKFMKKHHPDKCTLPHVVAVILNDYEGLLNMLSTDEDVSKVILPIMVAHKNKAAGQTAGAISSIQLPLTSLYTPDIFWVLSADEFNLDITNKKEPRFLCVANDPSLMAALSPCIAIITSVVMQNINQQGKNKSIFCIDELPTIFINKLDNLPATARSNKVVVCLSVQSYAQLVRDYLSDNAKVIIGNMGNQFFGMTNENETAERVIKFFGDHKVRDFSFSESDSGVSESHSYKKENIYQLRDVMGQDMGHFMGRIAGGKPPLFSVQLPGPGKRKMDAMKIHDIPNFSNPYGSKEELMEEVEKNFRKIVQEARDLVTPFIPVAETPAEEEEE